MVFASGSYCVHAPHTNRDPYARIEIKQACTPGGNAGTARVIHKLDHLTSAEDRKVECFI